MAMSRALGGTSLTMRSPMRISPELALSRPAIMRRSVDLPQPEGPTSTTNSPSAISIETPRTTSTGPKDLRSSRISMDAINPPAGLGIILSFHAMIGVTGAIVNHRARQQSIGENARENRDEALLWEKLFSPRLCSAFKAAREALLGLSRRIQSRRNSRAETNRLAYVGGCNGQAQL